ncbi:hypothetical protein EDD69_10449 [Thermolongibacillus altinsuensis]|jgi:hypothetical protein|uniref:UPF0738 protein EDD69_10449 n=1 Tax=Thermolongibacillus altinsuensis TaxID=575256 RepID=A0A4R1QNB4_9BACL|nr:hypothetical protein [Thermolongibacillus altinsuensis]TCL50999.1 hypothetical protein EDD69_10449 [Thermolongibacillus altinsuensis]
MQKKIYIDSVEKKEDGIYLIVQSHSFSLENAKAKRYMLVDSDHLSFIYIMEVGDEFVYVVMPQHVWPNLKEAMLTNIPVFLKSNEVVIELEGMKEELTYLIDNIKGNANYGDEMEKAVTEMFSV